MLPGIAVPLYTTQAHAYICTETQLLPHSHTHTHTHTHANKKKKQTHTDGRFSQGW